MLRILFITPNAPHPTVSAASQRSHLLYRSLRSIGETDTLLLNYPQRLAPRDMQRLRDEFGLVGCAGTRIRAEHGLWRFLRPLHPPSVDALARHFGHCAVDYAVQRRPAEALRTCLTERNYDIIVARYLRAATRTGAIKQTPLILDIDDLDTAVCRSELNVPGLGRLRQALIRRRLHTLERVETDLLSKCDGLWVSNPGDLRHPGVERARLLPNIPFDAASAGPAAPFPEHHDSLTIMSIGALYYPPNVAAVDYFVREVWPHVHAGLPGAVYLIVGPGLSEKLRRRWRGTPGVEPVGFVEDLAQAYEACAFTVAPTFEGGGTHVKVLESLYYGRLVIVSDYGLRGYENVLRHGESIYVARDRQEFITGCLKMLRNPAKRGAMAAAGACVVRTEYSFERFRAVVADTVRAVLRSSGQGIRPRL